jgi:hypothetical protein
MSLPPLFFYVIGTLLVVIGTLRVAMLGRRRASHELAEDTPAAAKARRQHLTFGVLWAVSGLVIIVWTAGLIGGHHP